MTTSTQKMAFNQRHVVENYDHEASNVDLEVKRKRRSALDHLDKQLLSMIKAANEAHDAKVLLVFWTIGTGNWNVDARRHACLLAKLPPQTTDPNNDFFGPIQKHYHLCKTGILEPRYLDFL